MSNPRSASNAWALIRKKLAAGNPDGEAIAPTPKKAGRPKKAAAAAEDEDGDATPKKTVTPRKRAAKKQDVDGEASPKKKGRGKKAVEEEGMCRLPKIIQTRSANQHVAKVREEEEESELPGKAGEMDDEMQEEV